MLLVLVLRLIAVEVMCKSCFESECSAANGLIGQVLAKLVNVAAVVFKAAHSNSCILFECQCGGGRQKRAIAVR